MDFSITYQFSNRFIHFLKSVKEITNYSYIEDLIFLNNYPIDISDSFKGTFIDFSTKDNSISFISIDKVFKLFRKVYPTETRQDVFDIWLKLNKDTLFKENRTEIRVGRFLNKILGKANDGEILEFVYLYRSYHNSFDYSFEIVYGEDIIKYYNSDNYHIENQKGSLKTSCMTYSPKGEEIAKKWGWNGLISTKLIFYAKNPNVGLLILKYKNSEKIKGRALIWTLKSGKKYMDIPYTDFEQDFYLFEKYVSDKKIISSKNYYRSEKRVESNDEIKSLFSRIDGNPPKYPIPHLDTFNYNVFTNEIYC